MSFCVWLCSSLASHCLSLIVEEKALTAKDSGTCSVNLSKAPLHPSQYLHEMSRNLQGFHIHSFRHQNVFLKLAHASTNIPIGEMAKQCIQKESPRLSDRDTYDKVQDH